MYRCQSKEHFTLTTNLDYIKYFFSVRRVYIAALTMFVIVDCKEKMIKDSRFISLYMSYTTMFHSFVIADENECAYVPAICLHNGACNNTDGGYNCTCSSGWTGKRCQIGELFINFV